MDADDREVSKLINRKAIIVFALGSVFGFSASLLLGFTLKSDRFSENRYYPRSVFTFERTGYTMSYDGRMRGANWVYERLTPESVSSDVANRKGVCFREDEEIPDFLRSTNEDFQDSGYDRGHLCPADDCKGSREAMLDSFLLSNVSPQVPDLNRGIWRRLESHVRQLTMRGKAVHVYTAPLFLPEERDGKRFVHYQVIGKHDVAVPTHFAKIALVEGENQPLVYILPNDQISKSASIDDFRTTIEKVERLAGMVFPRLDLLHN
jgi:endonuclease G